MPVVTKTEFLSSPEDLLSRHHALGYHHHQPPPSSVLLNGNTLRRSLFIFRAHHRACMERRKIGLSYELQVEAVRTGKFLEKIDCPSSTSTSKHTNSTNTKASGRHPPPSDMDTTNLSTKPEQTDSHCFKQSPSTPLASRIPSHDFLTDSKLNLNCTPEHNTHSMYDKIEEKTAEEKNSTIQKQLIKTEPISDDTVSQFPCMPSPMEHRPPKPTSLIPGDKNSTAPPKKKRRRFSVTTASLTPRSSSYSDDAGDDLSLSAEDCISGVLSTPPIKPLEEADNVLATPSPVTTPTFIPNKSKTKGTNRASFSPPNPLTNSTVRVGPETKKSEKKNLALKGDLIQDLDDFTKVMEMVTKEQLAKERQATLSTPQQRMNDPTQRGSPPRPLLSPPPYYPPAGSTANGGSSKHTPISQPNYLAQPQYPVTSVPRKMSIMESPLENRQLTRPHSLQMQKPPQQLVLSEASPQVDSSQLLSPSLLSTPCTPSATLGYPPMNTQPPRTPTTPLEHFSAISTHQPLSQHGSFFPQSNRPYQFTANHSSPWPHPHNSSQQAEPHLTHLDTLTSQKRPPMQGQVWDRPVSLTLQQFSTVSHTSSNNVCTPITLSNHSNLSYNHHHTL